MAVIDPGERVAALAALPEKRRRIRWRGKVWLVVKLNVRYEGKKVVAAIAYLFDPLSQDGTRTVDLLGVFWAAA